jgi:hypothetical protein
MVTSPFEYVKVIIFPAAIVAVLVAVPVRLLVSVTVSVTVYVPAAAKVCVGLAPVPVVLSPKFHAYVSVSLCGSLDPAPLKLTAVPVVPV